MQYIFKDIFFLPIILLKLSYRTCQFISLSHAIAHVLIFFCGYTHTRKKKFTNHFIWLSQSNEYVKALSDLLASKSEGINKSKILTRFWYGRTH